MKTKLRIVAGLVLFILLASSLTLVALAESLVESDGIPSYDWGSQSPDGIGLLATTIDVNTTDDELNNDGDCSLREAIQAANTGLNVDLCPGTGGSPYTINLIAGTYVLTHTNGDLYISSTLTISGTGASSTVIDGDDSDRVFDISSSGVVTISDVTITNGGNVNLGGGIRNQGTLVLNNSTVTDNTANDEGGGIYNEDGTVTLNNSTVSENDANGGPTYGFGGGISNAATGGNAATLTLNNSSVTTNTVDGLGGGGINNSSGGSSSTATMVLNQSTVSGNTATSTSVISTTGYGGGIRNGFYTSASGSTTSILTVNNSTISNNQAINGGGLGSGTIEIPQTVVATINNSTISGNTATGSGDTVGNGGGVVNLNGTMKVINSTVSGNAANGTGTATSGVGGGVGNGGFDAAATLWLTNTTVASNTAVFTGTGIANVSLTYPAVVNFQNSIIAGNCANPNTITGQLTSHDHNLEYNSVGSNTCGLIEANDITDSDPLLAPLANNGGDTETHALLKNSPAIDGGPTCSGSDQRGESRPGTGSSVCDIGAYELQGTDLNLKKTADDTTLSGVTTITYTITVSNPLVAEVEGVVVSDTLPSEVNFVSSSTANGSYNEGTGFWNFGSSITGSTEVTLEIVATSTLTGQTIVNTATIFALNQVDLNSSNDTDWDFTTIPASGPGSTTIYLPIVLKNS